MDASSFIALGAVAALFAGGSALADPAAAALPTGVRAICGAVLAALAFVALAWAQSLDTGGLN